MPVRKLDQPARGHDEPAERPGVRADPVGGVVGDGLAHVQARRGKQAGVVDALAEEGLEGGHGGIVGGKR